MLSDLFSQAHQLKNLRQVCIHPHVEKHQELIEILYHEAQIKCCLLIQKVSVFTLNFCTEEDDEMR